jgi:hypothetical protein
MRALGISVARMLIVQLLCVVLWGTGWLTRQAALIDWLMVGVLPPALALWWTDRPDSA